MRRFLTASAIALGLCLSLGLSAGLTPAHAEAVPTVVNITKPAPGTPILVVMPEVTLGLLTAGGSTDPKEEWSQNGRKYLNDGLNSALSVRKYSLASVDLSTYEDPRALQILKLNDTVSDTIAFNAFPGLALPTKTSFDWTLGDGASSLVPANSTTAPAYALFVRAKGTYSSGGRAAMMIGMAALGVGMPMGGQVITGSLVDLKTGQIVWYQTMGVPSGTDIRTPEGAGEAVNILFKKLPL